MAFREIKDSLGQLLRTAGCRRYRAQQALADVAEHWRELTADGQAEPRPFLCYIVAEDAVGVFAFYDKAVELYVVPGSERDFITPFEELAFADVAGARALLRSQFGRPEPDLIIPPDLASSWLAISSGGPAAG